MVEWWKIRKQDRDISKMF